MEADLSEPYRSPQLSLVGDEPSRAVDVERASELGQAADTHGPNPSLPPRGIVVNHDHARTIYEAAQYYALLYGTQVSVASTSHTFILVVEMNTVLHIAKSKRSCSWRDVNFIRDLVHSIRDCPNTQLALWTNRSGDGMRQLIKNTVHNIVHTFGLPLHRIAFAWTGDRSTLAGDLCPQPLPGTDPHLLIKDPGTVYNNLSSSTHTPLHSSLHLATISPPLSQTLGPTDTRCCSTPPASVT